jgi:hypothetical protein
MHLGFKQLLKLKWTKHKYWNVKEYEFLIQKGYMTPVLAFLWLNTSLGLFWTLVQVLLHTSPVHLSASCSLLLSERVRPRLVNLHVTCICIRLWWGWLIKCQFWWWLCTYLSKLNYITSIKSKGLMILNRSTTSHFKNKTKRCQFVIYLKAISLS